MTSHRERLRRFLLDRGGALAIVVLVVYVVLAPTTIVDGDNAELATLGAVGGRAHPSGYPAYVMYLRATTWIPGASAAHTAAIATCLLGALAVFTLHAACRAWGARPLAASFACALYAGSPIVLRMHVEAEVFAGNALVVATVLWLAAANGPVRAIRRGALLGLVAGLGLANHLTCSLVAPVGIVGAVRAIREGETRRDRWLAGLAAVAGLVAGLSAYLYLIVADGPVSFGRVDDAGDIVAFFLREEYGGPGAFAAKGGESPMLANLGALAESLGRAWLWLPGVLGLAMLGARIVGPKSNGVIEPRAGWIALAVAVVVAGPILITQFNVPPEHVGLYVVRRFHLLPILLLAIPVAAALDRAGTLLGRRLELVRRLGEGIAIGVFAVLVVVALPRQRAVHSPAMERGIVHMLQGLPERAVVVVYSDDLCFGVDYAQHARGLRTDVDVVCWMLISRPWYRERLRVPIGSYSAKITAAHATAIHATGRPLFVESNESMLAQELPSYPYGALIRILPRGTPPPPLRDVVELNATLYATYDLEYPRPGPDDDYATGAHKRYAWTWRMLAHMLKEAGSEDGSARALELERRVYPSGP